MQQIQSPNLCATDNFFYREKIVQVPLYSFNLHLINSNSKMRIKQTIPFFHCDTVFAHTTYAVADDNTPTVYVVLNNRNVLGTKLSYGVIAHEAYHTCNFIAKGIGMHVDPVNDEPIAHLLEWVTDQIHTFLNTK